MNLRMRIRQEPEVNLTSLIDVVLLLLIFFMVSTSFVKESEIKIQLPQATENAPATEDQPVEITITADGRFLVNGQALLSSQRDGLQRALEKVAGDNRSQGLTIRADANTPHQNVVTAMDVVGSMGFVNISIATTKSAD
ncbi:MAG: biopolymer transporter ExbD [Pseudomonadota bacterium]